MCIRDRVNVQRGGPSTGQPTKVEQGDLPAAVFGSHGDAPKVVMAPCSIEDCFYSVSYTHLDVYKRQGQAR